MDIIRGKIYVVDGKEYESAAIKCQYDPGPYNYYEVLRTTQGILLFSDDHLERLVEGIKLKSIDKAELKSIAMQCMYHLVRANQGITGNIKLLCKVKNDSYSLATYYIPHKYPGEKLYHTGVQLRTYSVERPNPQLKQVSVSTKIASEVAGKIIDSSVYEVLLIDTDGCITEGRRSNFFLIKDDNLFTAPDALVLPGITRKYVLEIARKLGVNVIKKRIPVNDLPKFESACICGTSPKILPANKIDTIPFQVGHPLLQVLMSEYDTIISQYTEKAGKELII